MKTPKGLGPLLYNGGENYWGYFKNIHMTYWSLASMDSLFYIKLLVHGAGLLSLKLCHWLYFVAMWPKIQLMDLTNIGIIGKPSLVSALSEEEYRKGIAALKNNKAAGIGDILVEQLKNLGPKAHKWLHTMLNSLHSSMIVCMHPIVLYCGHPRGKTVVFFFQIK